jgi:hypothetical protein
MCGLKTMIAEEDKVPTDSQSGKSMEFRGIVMRRIADRKIVERWDHLEAPHEAEAPHVGKAPHEGEAPA